MMRRLCWLSGLLALQGVAAASAEYLRERQEERQHADEIPASENQRMPKVQRRTSSVKISRRVKLMEPDDDFTSNGDMDAFMALANEFPSMSMPTPAPAPFQPSVTRIPTRAPVVTVPTSPRPTVAKTGAPVQSPLPPTTLAPFALPTRPPTKRTKRPTTLAPQSISPVQAPVVTTSPIGGPVSIPSLAPITVTTPPSPSPSTSPPITVAPTQIPPTFTTLLPSASPSIGVTGNTLLDIINTTPRYSSFASALVKADLATTVDTDELTVFAPNNQAMADKYITNTLLNSVNYRLHLTSFVGNHLTRQGVYTTANLTNGLLMTMLGNEQTGVNVTGSGSTRTFLLNTFAARLQYTTPVPLTRTDIIASNGILHEVGTALYPAWSFLNLMELLGLLNSRFSTLISLLASSGLAQTLQNARNITLVAPTNEAFAALPAQTLTQLSNPANVDQLAQVLLYHVVPGVIDFEQLPTGDTMFATEQGEDVTIGRRQRPNGSIDLFFNGNRSSLFYLTRLNIMYQVETVLLPPSYGGTLGPTAAPAPTLAPTPVPGSTSGTLATLIANNPIYSTFVKLLKDGGLLATLNQTGTGPFTLYAPTNAAFDALGATYLAALSTEPYSLHLSDLLLDHVQNGRFSTAQLVDGLVITMANGLSVTVSNDGTAIQLNTSSVELGETPPINVLPPERNAQNGILHRVDSVILPYWYFFDALQALQALPNTFSTFTSLIQQAGLDRVYANLVARTIAGPNNAAWQSLPASSLALLTNFSSLPLLTDTLSYHVIRDLLPFSTLPVGSFNASTLLGEPLEVTVTQNAAGGKLLAFNGISGVGRGFYLTKDNLIYEIGGVLIPPSLENRIPT